MRYKDIRKDFVMVTYVERDYWPNVTNSFLEFPGGVGAKLKSSAQGVRMIKVGLEVQGDSREDLLLKMEDLADWLVSEKEEELVLDDEPSRTYFAKVDGSFKPTDENWTELEGEVTFLCPDPYKYGQIFTRTYEDVSKPIAIQNLGSAETPPIFKITLSGPTTFLDIIGENDYMRIGQPYSVDQTPFKKYERIWSVDGLTMTGWGSAGYTPDGGNNSGTMSVANGNFYASNYGNGSSWHGPAVAQSIGSVISDYKVTAYLHVDANPSQRARSEVYLLDQSSNIIGKLAAVMRKSTGEVEIEINIRNGPNSKYILSKDWLYRDFFGYIDIIKEGTNFTVYIAQQGNNNGIYTRHKEDDSFPDNNNEFQTPLAAIGMHLATHSSYEPSPTNFIRRIDVERINQQPEGVEYIGDAGDIFEFNHKSKKIYKNGDLFSKKDFGSRFFDLKKGSNKYVVYPPNVVDQLRIEWRERYK
ncbi:distal tail protein Dit [Rossellomorea vietnamensis]|uniref:distal tail protein Dit n=1 Tax=Rossellomorea vietnamensis TaxID=218284 RepID=UPI000557A187|nr:distal tail protein Dit [Rossellomorea vietnamensis]